MEHKVEHKDDSPDGGEFQALCDIEVRMCSHFVLLCIIIYSNYYLFHYCKQFIIIRQSVLAAGKRTAHMHTVPPRAMMFESATQNSGLVSRAIIE